MKYQLDTEHSQRGDADLQGSCRDALHQCQPCAAIYKTCSKVILQTRLTALRASPLIISMVARQVYTSTLVLMGREATLPR